jgi:transcriptional regulator with XRE-family HTH domain
LSQEELAAAVSKDQKAISEYENGRRKLAVTDLPKLATVLQVPISYFFEEDTDTHDLDEALLDYFHQFASSEDREALIDMLRILTGIVRRQQTK